MLFLLGENKDQMINYTLIPWPEHSYDLFANH